MKRSLMAAAAGFMAASCAFADMPQTIQDVRLYYGWNAIYVEVACDKTADELFAGWPVNSVGLYDPAAFLSTRQFSADWDSQGLPRTQMATWYRDVPEASSLQSVPAGSVLMTFCTNETFSTILRGVPAAPRVTWHVTGTNTVHNLVGFSVSDTTDIADYLEGSPCEGVKSVAYYRIVGDDPAAAPGSYGVRSWDANVRNGEVLLLPSDKISDWSGVLYVTPVNGLYFAQDAVQSTLKIRNDGTASRTVTVQLQLAENADALGTISLNLYKYLYVRDLDAPLTDLSWSKVTGYGDSWSKELAPGATWNLQFGLDRLAFDHGERGVDFGALLKITEGSAANAKVVVPLAGETSGSAGALWQAGLWVAEVELDKIRAPGETVATETGGRLKMRLPFHIDGEGKVRLLQRVVAAGSVSEDGTYSYRFYAGDAKPGQTETVAMRISAVCLPTETPVIEATTASFGTGTLAFDFTVAGGGATSLLRHPFHPQHDGLRWDFRTAAPSGDDIENYKYDVKPETFSVRNHIKLSFDINAGVTAWNPDEMFSGTCEWSLTGLRHEGAIVVSGPMTVKRVAKKAEIRLD